MSNTTGLPPCRFFAQGSCTKGALCPFAHIAAEPSAVPCKFFLEGQCRYARNCRFSHTVAEAHLHDSSIEFARQQRAMTYWDAGTKTDWSDSPHTIASGANVFYTPDAVLGPVTPSLPSQSPDDIKCGICFEQLDSGTRRFGMLENCDHLFCLECIREWRKTGAANATPAHKQNVRSCPVCRVESFFVIPSDRHVCGEEKAATQNEYRKNMKVIPCKFWDFGRGSCNFGTSCFYAHLNMDGSRYIPPRLRKMASESGVCVVGTPTLLDFFPA